MDNKLIIDFFKHFESLTDTEQYLLTKQFKEITGGRLSIYDNPIPVAVAMVEVDNLGLLGIRRATLPAINGLALPGGYQEYLEDPKDAASRELFEETGIFINPSEFEIFGNPIVNHLNNQLLFFKCNVSISLEKFNSLKETDEALSYEIINHSSKLCFPLHQERVFEYLNLKKL